MQRLRWSLVVALAGTLLTANAGACRTAPRAPEGAPQKEEPSEELATFEFDWSDGMALEAEVRKRFRRSGGEERTVHAGYRMTVKERGEGVLVEFTPGSDPKVEGARGITVESAAATASSVALPSMSAASDGALESVEGMETAREKFRQFVRNLKGDSLEDRKERALEPLLAGDFLRSRARQFWSIVVGTWAGSQIAVGEQQTSDVSDTFVFPVVGEREVKLELEFSVEERVSCNSRPAEGDAGADPECVRIEMRSRPDVREMKAVLQEQVDRISERKARERGMDETPDLTVANVFVRTEMTLVTKPSKLRPYRWRDEKIVRMTLRGPAGEERSYKLVDQTRTLFTASSGGDGE